MERKVITPPIKSQGIKTKLVPWINELVAYTQCNGRWIEPFLGTGVVAFNMGFSAAMLNDTNPHIINFYSQLQNNELTPLIIKEYLEREGANLASSADNGYEHYRLVRNRFNKDFSPLDFLFLSRAGFNGMMRFSKKGHFNIPFCKKPERFAQAYVTKIVNQAKSVKTAITNDWVFTSQSFKDIIPSANYDDVIYCDPPYLGRYVDYYNGWTEEDEWALFDLLSKTKTKFILSTWHHNNYRKNEMIDKLWSRFNIITKDHFYHSGGKIENRNSIVEALVFNFEMNNSQKKTKQVNQSFPKQLTISQNY